MDIESGEIDSNVAENLDKNESRNLRKSFNKLLYDEDETVENEDNKWRLSYLKKQYKTLEIQSLFSRYTNRINHGYFSLFLILEVVLNVSHLLVVIVSNLDDTNIIIPDIILYGFRVIFAVSGIFIANKEYVKNNSKPLIYMSTISFLLLFFVNFFIPYYYGYSLIGVNLRPAYTSHLIICCYVFFNIHDNVIAFILGVFVSVTHTVTLIIVTYVQSTVLWQRICSDAMFMICINVLGVYFRYMNEILKRKSFLDRRGWIAMNSQLNHEKQQEEQLISSIIPEHIWKKVVENYTGNVDTNDPKIYSKHMGRQNNVSILFADIVNYTEMTVKFKNRIEDLIATLNDLFQNFDDASSKLNVLRIKFLGDCYYCVAGLSSVEGENHAENCVDLGLKMISIISGVRTKRNLNINMRIGIHSGSIISGIIGKKKWQYDIWSNDVDIANKMETEGEPGKVHITQQTKEKLTKEYNIEPTDKGKTVPQFIQNEIETYLISPDPSTIKDFVDNASQTDSSTRRMSKLKKSTNSTNSSSFIELQNEIIDEGTENNNTSDVEECVNPSTEVRRITIYKKNRDTSSNGKLSNGINDASLGRRSTMFKAYTFSEVDYDHSVYNPKNDSLKFSNLSKSNRNQLSFIEAQNALRDGGTHSVTENENAPQRRDTYREKNKYRNSSHKGVDERKYTETDQIRRTAFMNNNVKRYEERLQEINAKMKEAIEKMSLSKYQQWFKMHEINPLFLVFKKFATELQFIKIPDQLFIYYVLSELLVIICIFIIQNITLSSWQLDYWQFYLTVTIIILILIPLTWTSYLWDRKFSHRPKNIFVKMIYNISLVITRSVAARLLIYTVVCFLFSICVFSELFSCIESEEYEELDEALQQYNLFTYVMSGYKIKEDCIVPWHMTQTCGLAVIMSFMFLRIHLWIKFLYSATMTIVYSFWVWHYGHGLYGTSETFNYKVKPEIAHIMNVIFLTLTLHFIDRQTDYMYRLDYLWNEQLINEQKKANEKREANIKLLHNILPKHIANIYLNVKRKKDDFFHEAYDNVAVMFASIIDYPTISKQEMESEFEQGLDSELIMLKNMSQLFTMFDELIIKNYGKSIEKIKITKWTYMAACGIAPGLGKAEIIKNDSANHPLVTLLNFATGIMKGIPGFNLDANQECKLRIGICFGPVVGGVVGSKKPLYDIWGDTVNMASRMDTTGLPNRIQVLEETAELIKKLGYVCTYRGLTKVKGKNNNEPVPTYFVPFDKDYNLIKEQQ